MKFVLLTIFLFGFLICAVSAQEVIQEPKPAITLRLETDLVSIDVTVTDRQGNYIRDMKPDEFTLYEDGKPRKIDFFTVNDSLTLTRPLAVVFALDTSGSLKPEESRTLHQAAMKFTTLLQGDSVFSVLAFNNNVKVLQDFTNDVRRIENAFSRANRFEGSTRIYDAIDRGITLLERKSPRIRKGRPVRRVIIVISDGFDSSSTIDRREMVRRANAAGVTVYSITLPSYVLTATQPGMRVITPLDATRVVSVTGGIDLAADSRDFTPVFKALAEEISSSYIISYYPDWRDGRFHDLKVRTSRPGAELRVSRNGYLAPSK